MYNVLFETIEDYHIETLITLEIHIRPKAIGPVRRGSNFVNHEINLSRITEMSNKFLKIPGDFEPLLLQATIAHII